MCHWELWGLRSQEAHELQISVQAKDIGATRQGKLMPPFLAESRLAPWWNSRKMPWSSNVWPCLTNVWCPAISGTIGHDVGIIWVYHISSRTYQIISTCDESNLTILNTYSKSETEICLKPNSMARSWVARTTPWLSMAAAGVPWNKPAPSWYTTSHGKRFRMLDINSGSMYRAASIPWSCFDSLIFLGMTLGCKLCVRKNIMIVVIIIVITIIIVVIIIIIMIMMCQNLCAVFTSNMYREFIYIYSLSLCLSLSLLMILNLLKQIHSWYTEMGATLLKPSPFRPCSRWTEHCYTHVMQLF